MTVQNISNLSTPPPRPLRLAETALFLDLDGTLAPIAARPQDVGPDARRTDLLESLARRLNGRLAVITGRTLSDVDHILEGCVPAVAAVHGLVRRDADGLVTETRPHPAVPRAAAALRTFAVRDPGLLVEDKAGLSVALHFRQAREHAPAARAFARELAQETGLGLQSGDMVAELRTPGARKGDSLRAFMGEPCFAGARPVFMGDDATDEDGFAAAEALGGFGVLVGPPRPTGARFRLDDVAAALDWLEASR
ncbi:trehalose-phosphatase [Phenylobacterium sp.]|jgi:trehalose 6-phosphate phosphatase|uniref:trehalose-phosphatase n=1 Tax=Phenylobacterium sp. TaxID=1871053 RepID=UPI002F3ED4DE